MTGVVLHHPIAISLYASYRQIVGEGHSLHATGPGRSMHQDVEGSTVGIIIRNQ
jgi:hypothetical protein